MTAQASVLTVLSHIVWFFFCQVRRDGSFVYEDFLATGGTDVKVYTVGPR